MNKKRLVCHLLLDNFDHVESDHRFLRNIGVFMPNLHGEDRDIPVLNKQSENVLYIRGIDLQRLSLGMQQSWQSASRSDRLNPAESLLGKQWIRRWVDPRTGLDAAVKGKSLSSPEI
jgi:hypothetical protein